MVSFKRKKVENESKSLKEILTFSRSEKQIQLSKIEKETQIQQKYLLALEKGNYAVFPGQIYGRNFLRAYAKYLGLDVNRLIDLFNKEYEIYFKFSVQERECQVDFKRRSMPGSFVVFPKILKNLMIVIIVIALVGYISFKVKSIVTPPYLLISSPADNMIIEDDKIDINGKTEKEAELTINNEEVLIGDSGQFSKTINLKEGLNIIEIIAYKKHSRESIVKRHVLVTKNRDKEYILSN